MVTRIEFHARSITIFATAANCSFFLTEARISRSLWRNAGSSWGDAYQRERQSRFTPSLNPIGLTFCPIKLFLGRLRGLLLAFFRRCRFCSGLPGFLFLIALRLSRFSSLNCHIVRQNDSNMTRPFQNLAATAASARLHSFESRTLAHNGFLHDQTVGF